MEPVKGRRVRVGVHGTGDHATRTHIPLLAKMDGVQIVGLCDTDSDRCRATAQRLGLGNEHTYTSGLAMLEGEDLDVLFSCVPPFARLEVEVAAARKGIHIFCEKPPATSMAAARAIDRAIGASGVFSTVGFRERYRPLIQKVRDHLSDKTVIHASCTLVSPSVLPKDWLRQEDLSGGFAMEWGIHAVDCLRFMTGLEISQAQAFYFRRPHETFSLSQSLNFRCSSGATMSLSFVVYLDDGEHAQGRASIPLFTIYYVGGRIDVFRNGRDSWTCEVNGRAVLEREVFDPWLEQDRVFINAIRSGHNGQVLSDYRDSLYTLAPVLAGWESARRGGECIDVPSFMSGGSL